MPLCVINDILHNIQNGIQPIHSACYGGHENVVKLLVEMCGVDPTVTMEVSRTSNIASP